MLHQSEWSRGLRSEFSANCLRRLQQLEHFKIVALDVEVFSGVPVLALFGAEAQGLADGLAGLHDGRLLAHPCKLITLVPVYHIRGEHLLEHLKIYPTFELAVLIPHLRDAVGEQRGNALYILLYPIRDFKLHVIHQVYPLHHLPVLSGFLWVRLNLSHFQSVEVIFVTQAMQKATQFCVVP